MTNIEVPTVRHTVCRLCELEVEVALDDIGMLTLDRGGNALCVSPVLPHDPVLDPEDYEAHDYWMGEVAEGQSWGELDGDR